MRIVLDARTATNHFPGIGRYVVNLAQALMPHLMPSERLILLRDSTQPSLWDLTALTGSQVQWVEAPVSPFSLRQQWLIPRLLRQLQADVYHSPYYLMPYRPGIPTVLTIYDLIPLHYPHYFPVRTRLMFKLTTRLALQAAHHLTAISEATRRDLLANFAVSPHRVAAIPLAADPIFSPVTTQKIQAVRQRLGLPDDYLLYVGSNKPHKNLVRLIEAWDLVNRNSKIANRKLVMAGVWDARYPQAQQRVTALGLAERVQFLGPVAEADLPALYSGALAFVFPSEYEGFGLPVLEAMACGAPVACANVSSLPEVAGEAALMFNPHDVTAIAAALTPLLADDSLRQKLTGLGLARTGKFTWAQVAQETLNLYRNSSGRP